jgi:hypothetical protein
MEVKWAELSPEEFERLCCLILEANDFTQIQWYGKSGGDKDRDIVARKVEKPIDSIQVETKWVVQCKRYLSKPPSKNELASFLNSCREHRPDNAFLLVTNTLSPDTKDWLEAVRHDYPFRIHVWEERDLLRQVFVHKDKIGESFPQIYRTGKQVLLYQTTASDYWMSCDETEEVYLVAVNCRSHEDAKNKAREFIEVVRQNEVVFD